MGGFQSIGTVPSAADDRISDESTVPKANDNEEHKVNIGDEGTNSPSDRGPSLVQTAGSPTPGPNLLPLNDPDVITGCTGMGAGTYPIRIPSGRGNGSGNDDSSRNQNRATGDIEPAPSPSQSGSLLESLSPQSPDTPATPRRAADGLADPLSPDPALAPDQAVKTPPIPDKAWEEARQRRAAKAEEAPKVDWWQAQKMADTLSQTTDYGGAEQHYRRQADSDPIGTRAEIDAVAQSMGQTDPQAAQRFLGQMDAAGLRRTDSLSRGQSYSESEVLGSWRSNVESQTGQTLTPASETRAVPQAVDPAVTRDLDVLRDRGNAPGYAQWLAEAARTDPEWAATHGRALSRELYKSDPQAAETLARHAEQSGLDLYAKGYQTDQSLEAIMSKANGGWIASGGDKAINGGKECVALVKSEVPELRNVSTKAWTRGEDIRGLGDPPLKPGTAIAKGWDADGNYPSNSTGNHAMFYFGPDEDNPGQVKVVDQFAPRGGANWRNGQPVRVRSITPEKLSDYSVIHRK
jgi:hypothetical protein